MAGADQTFSDDDLREITEGDLAQRSQALDDAQAHWETVAYLSQPRVPCPECGGRGVVTAGVFGDVECVRCQGQRVIEHPGAEPFAMPPFAQLRAAISDYGNALADRALPEYLADGRKHPGKRHLALPPASSVPSLASINEIYAQGVAKAKALQAAPGIVDGKLLGERKRRSDDDEGAGDFDDDELDKQEADDGGE